MHFAAEAGLVGVGIYKAARNTVYAKENPLVRLYPWNADIKVIRPERVLAGCERGCLDHGVHCIKQITEDDVKNAVEQALLKVHCDAIKQEKI